MNRRQRIGFVFTVLALFALLGAFAWMGATMQSGWVKRLIGMAITLLPLLLFVRGAITRNLRSYQALALLAPVYLFVGGVVWLWADWRIGAWICVWAFVLEVGAILHNYQRRKKKKHGGNS